MNRLLDRLARALGLAIVATLVALLAVSAVGSLQGRDRALDLAHQAITSRDRNAAVTARQVASVHRQVVLIGHRDAAARRVLLRDIHELIAQLRHAHVKPQIRYRTVVRIVHRVVRTHAHRARAQRAKPTAATVPTPAATFPGNGRHRGQRKRR